MSGFGARFPGGLRRGRGRARDRDTPTTADRQRTHTPVPPEAQHYEQYQMAEIEASGYTDADPLETEEFTGGAQWEEGIEEPPTMEATIAQGYPLHAPPGR